MISLQVFVPLFFIFYAIISLNFTLAMVAPTRSPTAIPSAAPTRIPTPSPSAAPTRDPFVRSRAPTSQPTGQPSSSPTVSKSPIFPPTGRPTDHPTSRPSGEPSSRPSAQPSSTPTGQPTFEPTSPTGQPSSRPTEFSPPTSKPTQRTEKPTITYRPSRRPTSQPTSQPSSLPSGQPTGKPSIKLSARPTAPTGQPSGQPSRSPTSQPSGGPSGQPTSQPSQPTSQPSGQPTGQPICNPTMFPISYPTSHPTGQPSGRPTSTPTKWHTLVPTSQPSSQPSGKPTQQPTQRPTSCPTNTRHPSNLPSDLPTSQPSGQPTGQPTESPSAQPSSRPSRCPSSQPTSNPSSPSSQPSSRPTKIPSNQPTSRPTGQPSSQPSRSPSSQPTSKPSIPTGQPSSRPSGQPSRQPTSKPTSTNRPTSMPSSEPTIYTNQPTSHPSCPTDRPTSRPTSIPTNTYRPTFRPTSRPTSHPTSRPSFEGGFAFTNRPTGFFQGAALSGNIVFEPQDAPPCTPLEITFYINFGRNLTKGSIFTISAPGITSGPCYSPQNGRNVSIVSMPVFAGVNASFFDGKYDNNYQTAYFSFLVTVPLLASEIHTIIIDRTNELRKTCTLNSTWVTSVFPLDQNLKKLPGGQAGYLDFIENYPQVGFAYNTTLKFSSQLNQLFTDINLTFYLPFAITRGTVIRVKLPGFTNRGVNLPMNPVHLVSTSVTGNLNPSFIGNGRSSDLYNMTWNTSFSWTGYWHEGDYSNNYQDAYFELTSHGTGNDALPFWIYIPKDGNMLVPICGHPENSSEFTYSITSSYFWVNTTQFSSSNPVGFQCDCNGNGVCNYCTRQCDCNDGYGSVFDRLFSVADDFQPDCSSKVCPKGPAVGLLLRFGNNSLFNISLDAVSNTTHSLIECSNSGKCDRSTGTCRCNPGFTGAACNRLACPGHPMCSGRGRCLTMRRLARNPAALPLTLSSYGYTHANSWDANFGQACVCDSSWEVGLGPGQVQLSEFFGNACELRRCPSGDDPDTLWVDETNCTAKAQTGGTDLGLPGNKCHVDCSNRGLCNYQTGLCSCFPGYGGHNCGFRV